MFTIVPVSSDRYSFRHQRLTIDIICPQTPRLYDGKCANNETPEGVRDDLFLAACSGSVEDERVVIEPMEFRGSLRAWWCDFPVILVEEGKVEQASRTALLWL